MKRKIAAIFAADIAGYSRLVAEDEEETLRRLASYRLVIDDFIAKASGRIFNTAGDAVLAEFPSAVEAVRCAIDIQESLRTRNMAYPPSRQMSFRIGITIGDVVERDGDLLGDGVNIAARLEGLAEVGGICVSRAVHEQVANKLSVQFADIGAQEVKNIPTPVHAYMVAMRREDGTYATPQVKKVAKASPAPNWMWPLVVGVVSIVAIGVGGFLYFTKLELAPGAKQIASDATASPVPSPSSAPPPAVTASPSPSPTQSASAPPAPLPGPGGEKLVANAVPFVGERVHAALEKEYLAAADYKAFALNVNGNNAYVAGQTSEDAARNAALEQCQKRADAVQSPRRCEVYAVGNIVVYAHGKPPMPPTPWVRRDSTTERPFVAKDMPMVRDQGKGRLEGGYLSSRKSRSIALGPGGQFIFNVASDSVEESTRRSLESCGALAGVACMVVAVDDVFVVPVPMLMKATGFFKAASNSSIVATERDEVARQLADAASGWNAVAVGTAGRAGIAVKAASEQSAVNDALGNCAKRDSDCHVIAIGPFTVGPAN
ncbi:adenylate/guanylate cyclase domain-containing protein [Bradyrhizobium manausense]|uniref:adenylate/guanylate cyclase domain-containing protein n=1 Tax=Bradyrhizobium manausense TaxID=989370 RepID=UPI001BA61452|nr:adenylate/guanylate cyclase domain-containing protein [Bradyrhizobium manausense]MBR1091561.1 adenylate/guanylate cyclase domain-containing protein [Bradyrhizobium manausense]